jgi:hypothetical protein
MKHQAIAPKCEQQRTKQNRGQLSQSKDKSHVKVDATEAPISTHFCQMVTIGEE